MTPERPYEELSNRAIRWSAVALAVLGIGLAVVLLVAFGDGQHADQLNAIRTAGTIVLGTGGAAALWLAARRQRTSEIALNQKHIDQRATDRAFEFQLQVNEQNRQHQERVAAATEHDAEARRITELYSNSVEQLGSDKAPVRLGGLYALERLAQDNPAQRQTIVNVLCAYLRMPAEADQAQDREVRLTAQRLLAKHLRRHSGEAHWGALDLDLTGAVLEDFVLDDCDLGEAIFTSARFTGFARFVGTKFGSASFQRTEFCGEATFTGAVFTGHTVFSRASFAGEAFLSAQFDDETEFEEAEFAAAARFDNARFESTLWIHGTRFRQSVSFDHSWFGGTVRFRRAEVAGDAGFHGVRFGGAAQFEGVQFSEDARFGQAEFVGRAHFDGVEFGGAAGFVEARFDAAFSLKGARFCRSARFYDAEFADAIHLDGVEFARARDGELLARYRDGNRHSGRTS